MNHPQRPLHRPNHPYSHSPTLDPILLGSHKYPILTLHLKQEVLSSKPHQLIRDPMTYGMKADICDTRTSLNGQDFLGNEKANILGKVDDNVEDGS